MAAYVRLLHESADVMPMPRDFDKTPYTADETRVAKFWFDKGIGGGEDPIGSLMASHETLAAQRNELRRRLKVAGLDADV